jgi:hypothetical protein
MGGGRSFSGPSISGGRTFSGPSIGGDRGFSGRSFSRDGGFSGSPGFRSDIGPRAPSNLFRGDDGRFRGGDNRFAGRDFDHHGGHDGDRHHHHRWYGGYPGWWWGPGLGLGYWGGYGYGYPGYYDYGYSQPYSYGVASVPYEGGGVDTTSLTADTGGGSSSSDYFNQALNAFRSGNYQEALRLAGHAAIDMRNDARPHELASLALFALGNYQGAAMEAHAALSLGQPADWNTLYSYYNDLPTYQRQLDALSKYATEHPDATEAKFLLGYHNLMMGHKDLAQQQLADVVKAAPNDQLAAKLLESIGGKVPARPEGQPQGQGGSPPGGPQNQPGPGANQPGPGANQPGPGANQPEPGANQPGPQKR